MAIEEEKSIILTELFNNQMMFGAAFIPIIIITCILLMGTVRLCNNLMQSEKVNINVYFSGIKDNFKQGLIIGVLISILYNFANFIKWYKIGSLYTLILYYTIIIFSCLVVAPIMSIFINASSIYNGKILVAIKNSIKIYLATFFKTTLINLVLITPILLIFIFNMSLFVYAILIILIVYGFGLIGIINCSYSQYLFDIYVNPKYYPNLYMKGL